MQCFQLVSWHFRCLHKSHLPRTDVAMATESGWLSDVLYDCGSVGCRRCYMGDADLQWVLYWNVVEKLFHLIDSLFETCGLGILRSQGSEWRVKMGTVLCLSNKALFCENVSIRRRGILIAKSWVSGGQNLKFDIFYSFSLFLLYCGLIQIHILMSLYD